ncbi:MAG: JAB domain-containing protein [Clostridia bacterium]|nr:JAB domain-containing protein [Clostridia bacterium]
MAKKTDKTIDNNDNVFTIDQALFELLRDTEVPSAFEDNSLSAHSAEKEYADELADSDVDGTQGLNVGHRKRLRERIKAQEFNDIQAHEALECLLFLIVKRKNTNSIAHMMLNKYHSLHQLLSASVEDLKAFPEITEQGAEFLTMFPKLAQYYVFTRSNLGKNSVNMTVLAQYASEILSSGIDEGLLIAYFDSNNRQIYQKFIRESINVSVSVRDIVKTCMRFEAASVFIAHSHPSDISKPSVNDDNFTRTLHNVLKALDVFLIDHVVVSKKEVYSYRIDGFFDVIFSNDDVYAATPSPVVTQNQKPKTQNTEKRNTKPQEKGGIPQYYLKNKCFERKVTRPNKS